MLFETVCEWKRWIPYKQLEKQRDVMSLNQMTNSLEPQKHIEITEKTWSCMSFSNIIVPFQAQTHSFVKLRDVHTMNYNNNYKKYKNNSYKIVLIVVDGGIQTAAL